MSYAQEKLFQALTCLVSEGPLQKRLAAAAMYLIRIQPNQFENKEHLEAWERIKDDLTWVEPDYRGEGKIISTTKRMIEQDADRCARQILELFVSLSGGLRP
jgi:hypothetical protein